MKQLIQRLALKMLRLTDYPTCGMDNCTCAQGWPCLDCDPTETEPTHTCPDCGRLHYEAKEGQDLR